MGPPNNIPWATHLDQEPSNSHYQTTPQRVQISQQEFQHRLLRPNLDEQPPAYADINSSYASHPKEPSTTFAGEPSVRSLLDHGATSDISTSEDDGDDVLRQALEFTNHVPPPNTSGNRLSRMVCVPQACPGTGMPFSRCYSEELRRNGVSMEEFVEFIDNFNVVSAGSPPLQVLDVAGGIIGMIPLAHAQLISSVISATARLGKAAVSKTRGTVFIERANARFFNPRGLKVEIVTKEALQMKLGMDPNQPLEVSRHQSDDLSLHERRATALRGYAAELTFNVPPPNKETNLLNRMSAFQQQHTMDKVESKANKSREKSTRRGRDAREMNKENDRRSRKGKEKVGKRDKEAKTNSKILWILIENYNGAPAGQWS